MVEAGERYRHFKGGEYEIIDVAPNCDNAGQMLVKYKALYGEGGTWDRSLDEFCGDKVFDDGRRVKRFELIDESSV